MVSRHALNTSEYNTKQNVHTRKFRSSRRDKLGSVLHDLALSVPLSVSLSLFETPRRSSASRVESVGSAPAVGRQDWSCLPPRTHLHEAQQLKKCLRKPEIQSFSLSVRRPRRWPTWSSFGWLRGVSSATFRAPLCSARPGCTAGCLPGALPQSLMGTRRFACSMQLYIVAGAEVLMGGRYFEASCIPELHRSPYLRWKR